MRVIRRIPGALALAAAALLVPACHDDNPSAVPTLTYLPTTTYDFATGSSDQTTEVLPVVTSADVDFFESQSGIAQAAGTGLVLGSVRDASGTSLAGVTVSAIDDANASVGTVVYRNASGFWSSSATSTSGFGSFIVFNVPPGRINLRATSGASGNAYVRCAADEATVALVTATAPFSTVTWSGITRNLSNVPGASEATVTLTGLGVGAGLFPASSGAGGVFSTTAPAPARNTYLLRLSKGGPFVNTLNVFDVGTSPLSTPGGDLLIVSTANRSSTNFKPASITLDATKGILRGVLAPSGTTADGFVVVVRKADGTLSGAVRYGGTTAPAGAPDETLTASSTNGIFYVYNVDVGSVLVTASKTGFAGGASLDVEADSITLATLAPSSLGGGTDTILVAGFLQTSTGTATVAFGTASVEGTTLTSGSDALGSFAIPGVPSNQRLRVRATKP
jgi:hypothetical protein